MTKFTSIASAIALVAILASGCEPEDALSMRDDTESTSGAEDTEPDETAPQNGTEPSDDLQHRMFSLVTRPEWEQARSRPVVSDTLPEGLDEETPASRAAALRAALADPAWYSSDGRRYEAMTVLPDGRAFGRLGEAPAYPTPSEENSFGRDPLLQEIIEDSGLTETQFFAAIEAESTRETGLGPSQFKIEEAGPVSQRIWTDTSIDDRGRVGSTTTLGNFPYKSIGAIHNTSTGHTTAGCSGTKIGPRAILTASHCVLQSNGTVTTTGIFSPGKTNAAFGANGSFSWVLGYLRDWRLGRQYDYAILYVSDTAANSNVPWLTVQYWNTESTYNNEGTRLTGYPCGPNAQNGCGLTSKQKCAASPRSDERCDGWMYEHYATLKSNPWDYDGQLHLNNDGSSGQSGSTVRRTNNQNVLGVYWGSITGGHNYAARFRSYMWNDVCSWIADAPSAYTYHPLCY